MKNPTTIYLEGELKKKVPGVKLPLHFGYDYDSIKKNLTLKIKRLTANMQKDEAAFDSWAMVLKYYLSELIQTITIDLDELPEVGKNEQLHINRLMYRITKFIQTYDWVRIEKQIPPIPSVLVNNCPTKEAAGIEKFEVGAEGWLERKFVDKYKYEYDYMNHQFPVGVFDHVVSKPTYYFTGNKSAIDIWAAKDDEFYVFELKIPSNKPLGIISELMFYVNIINDILSHQIIYDASDSKTIQAVKDDIRGFKKFYELYLDGSIKRINGIFLSDELHPLITEGLLNFINESARLKFSHINFSIKQTGISL